MDRPPLDSNLRAQLMAHVAALEAQRAAVLARIAADQALVEQLTTEIDGGHALMRAGGRPAAPMASPTVAPALAAAPVERRRGRQPTGPGGWSEFIFDQLEGRPGGLRLKEFMNNMAGTPWAEKLMTGRNSFYNAISKLENSGRLIRRDGVIYHPQTLAKIDAGEIVEERSPEPQGPRLALETIERVVRDAGRPIKAGDVVDAIREIPEAEHLLRRNTQIIYATLSRMVQGGRLERDWRGYYSLKSSPTDGGNVVPLPSTNGGQR